MRIRLRTTSGASVGIEGDRVVEPDGRFDVEVDVGPGELRPGLINAHDHLHRNHFPRLGAPPYPNAYTWGEDLHARYAAEIARAGSLEHRDALLFGALKNLLGGVTTVVHHDAYEAAFEQDFPVRVARVRVAHSLRLERDLAGAIRGDATTRTAPLCIHVAEGSDAAAADEVHELARRGVLDQRLVAVHVVGVDQAGVDRLRAARATVVWCPTSNGFLLHRTLPRAVVDAGVRVLVGSDSLLTGAGTLLDELRAARGFGYLDDRRLEAAVGTTAAQVLALPAPNLAPGARADLVLLRRRLFEARAGDVALVLVGGTVRLGDVRFAGLFERQAVPMETLVVAELRKLVAKPLATVAARVCALTPECARILQCEDR